jgi:iron complex transport system substrate-binding protein
VQAVREGRIYVTPEYVKPWGHPCPESIGLGELWMAKKLYPEIFADIDMEAYVNDFYKTFYGIAYSGSH